jgi:hypothetical protein
MIAGIGIAIFAVLVVLFVRGAAINEREQAE